MDKLLIRLGLFLLVYISLLLISRIDVVKNAHLVYYCQVGDRVFNMINPNQYANFIPEAPPNDENWNTTVALYSREKHGAKLRNKSYRNRVNPNRYFYRDTDEIIMLPTFFLLSLFLITPGLSWKKGIPYFLACLLILYIFLSFHFSHIFENLIINEGQIGDSFWHHFISIFGFKGLTEPLYIIALVSWASFTFRSEMLKYFK